jgi:hypothetical protein
MFKVLAFLSRKPGMSPKEFKAYYETRHVQVINEVAPGIPVYRRNFLQLNDPQNRNADQINFDVVTEMEFPDRESFQLWAKSFAAPGAAERVAEDEAQFIDRDHIRVCVVEVSEND